jgi:hypothetical protein
MPASRRGCARNALPVDPVVVRRRLRAIERSLRVLRALDWIEQTEEFAAAIEEWLERNVDQA